MICPQRGVAATEGLTADSTDDTDVHKKMGPTKHTKDTNKKSLSPNFRVFSQLARRGGCFVGKKLITEQDAAATW